MVNILKLWMLNAVKILGIIFILLITPKVGEASQPIYCPKTYKHLYNYQGVIMSGHPILAKDFIPASNDVPQPMESSKMVCPLCGAPLNGYLFWFWDRKLPEPKLIYDAVTLMTFQDGEFKWVPWDLTLED